MRRLLIVGVVTVGSACSDSSGPKVDPNVFVGTWSVAVDQSPKCWEAFSLRFSIDPDDATPANEELMNFVSSWWFPNSPSSKNLVSGNINWFQKTFTVVFNRSNRRALFEGTNPTSSRLVGTLTDLDVAFGSSALFCGGASASAVATK